MFCKNCGNQIPEGVKFCSSCGTPQDTVQIVNNQTVEHVSQPNSSKNTNTVPQKPKGKGKIGGIVMIVLGILAFLGGLSNGFFSDISTYGASMADIVTILLEIGLIVSGIYFVYKSKKQ